MVSIKKTLQKEGENWALLLLNLFREGAHMGKIILAKRERQKKRLKELLYIAQMDHLYGGSKISKTSNSSNSSNNNSNFGGPDLAGPPVR